jgi:predicted phage-related endonuclease
MKIHEAKQGSSEWFQLRLGIVTASEVDSLITPKWKIKEGAGVDTYLYRKLAEKALNYSPDQLETFAMDQGKLIETVAIPWYEFETGKKVRRVGFCTTDDSRAGCSPDGLLEDGTGLEIKSPQAPNHIRYLLEGKVPDDYLAQVHFSMLVTGAPSWTFCSYSMHLPALVIHVQRDESIQAKLREAVDAFNERFDSALATLKAKSA